MCPSIWGPGLAPSEQTDVPGEQHGYVMIVRCLEHYQSQQQLDNPAYLRATSCSGRCTTNCQKRAQSQARYDSQCCTALRTSVRLSVHDPDVTCCEVISAAIVQTQNYSGMKLAIIDDVEHSQSAKASMANWFDLELQRGEVSSNWRRGTFLECTGVHGELVWLRITAGWS